MSYCGLIDAKIRASDKDLPVKDFIGIFATKEVNYDNFTFKLFYRATFGLCVLASLLLGLFAWFFLVVLIDSETLFI